MASRKRPLVTQAQIDRAEAAWLVTLRERHPEFIWRYPDEPVHELGPLDERLAPLADDDAIAPSKDD